MSDALSIFHELGDATRLRVLAVIVNARKNVSAIVRELGLSQPQVSYHLRRLKDAGLAVEEKDGRWVWYEANHASTDIHVREMLEYVARWVPGQDAAAGAGETPHARPARLEAGDEGRPVVERPGRPDNDMEDFLL